MQSDYLKPGALKGLNRIGDIFIPGAGDLPSFSEFGGIEHVDDVIAYAPEEDIADLNLVLRILSVLPQGVLRWAADQMMAASHKEGRLAALLRQLNIGLKGILFSCYYSGKAGSSYTGKNPLDLIGYSVNRVED
ncbi:MAG: hypothetical protein ACYSWO_22335 [Planctomycetota bacterium]|jgi:hypothetical protein